MFFRKPFFIRWLIALAISLPLPALAQYHNFKAYTIEDGLPQSNVYSILQDDYGYLWIGTDGGGVSRFDGFHFKTYNRQNGLPGNVVRSIAKDHAGHLWFGTDEGIAIFDGLQFRHIGSDQGLSGSTVLSFYEDIYHNMWVGTDDGGLNMVHVVDADSVVIHVITQGEGLSNNTVFRILGDEDHNLWLATFGGINVVNVTNTDYGTARPEYQINHLRGGREIPSDYILSIAQDKAGDLWFGTYDSGVFKITDKSKKQLASVITFPLASGLSSKSIWDISCDASGDVWIGTGENGLCRFRDSTFVFFTEAQGLPSNQILSLHRDREGNLWMGTNGDGLGKFLGEHFAHFLESDGLSNEKVQGIEQAASGNFWLVSDGGGLSQLSLPNGNPVFTNYTAENVSPFATSVAIGKSTNDHIWIGTTNQGIIKFDGTQFTKLNETDGLISDRVNQVYVDGKGIVWIATAGGISRYDGVKFLNVSMERMGISDDGVNAIVQSRDSALWFATSGGLARYSGDGSIQTFDEEEGLHDKSVNVVAEGPEGNIWIGTNGGGIYRYNRASQDSLPIQFWAGEGLLHSNAINSLIFQNDRVLIAGTDKGFDKLILGDSQQVLRAQHYDATDGFIGVECNDNAIWRDKQGQIWFGTGRGLTRYAPDKEPQNVPAPQTHITGLQLFFKDVDWGSSADSLHPWFGTPKSLELKHFQNHLTFHFSGIFLSNPDKVRYRYKLEGLDGDWSPPGRASKTTYQGLSPGEYTFMVRATNGNGEWSDQPASYRFVINPPWYQTTWFYLICAAAFIIGFYLFVKIRERNLLKEKKILEDKVEERTREVVMQKEEIEQQNQEIRDSINYARKIQEAILPRDESVQQILKDSFVLFKPKDIVSGDFYWITERDGLGFFTAADCTGHGVPGAFMSMIGTSLLNEVVNEKGIVEPNAILFEVRKGIITSLKQTGEEGQQKDGMDMALCAIDKANMLLHYAGANNSLYVIRASETLLTDTNGATVEVNQERNGARLFEVKATKQPVGYYTGNMAPYDLHTFHLLPGDVLYTFSDGYADQFGGPKGKKFKYLPFKRLLLDNYQQPMESQRELLDQTIIDWMMGEHEQIDDICIIGVRI